MKWIGQHIWDFISRFRSDVYLEGTESGTIASGGNLGLDSNNKIVKATGVSSASTVTVTDSSANTAFPIVFHDESNGLLDDTGTLTYTPFSRSLGLAHSSGTVLALYDTGDTAADSHIYFKNTRGGGASSDGDNLGTLTFQGHNDAGANVITYADFTAYIESDSASNEAGAVKIQCRYQGGIDPGLQLYGSNSSSRIDADIGHGTASVTTIAGDLTTLGDDISMSSANSGKPLVELKSTHTDKQQSAELKFLKDADNVEDDEALGEISFYGDNDRTSGGPEVIQYGRILGTAADMTDGQEAGELIFSVAEYDGNLSVGLKLDGDTDADGEVDVTIGAGTASTTTIAGILTMGSTAAMTNAGLLSVANQSNITGLGTISSGTWQGTAVADAYVANDLTISGGTVNNSVIGGSTPAAITGTTIDANTDFTVGSTVITDDQIQFTPSTSDTATISAGSNGTMTLSTSDAGGSQGYIDLTPDGDIRLSPGTNKIWEIFDFHTTNFENTYSSGHHGGKVLRHSNGTSDLTLGQIYYLRSNGHWVEAYADDDDSGGPGYGDSQMLGVGLGNPQSVGVLIEGFVRIPYTEILNNPGSGNVDGLPLYVSAGTAGHFDFNAPSDSGDFVRIVGYAIDDYDTGSGNMDVLVYFNPSKTYIERA